jgi:hypothetical protein
MWSMHTATLPPPCTCLAWCIIKQRDNFTLSLPPQRWWIFTEVMHFSRKGTYGHNGKFLIYKETMKENQLNEEQMISYNMMFKVMLNKKCQLTSLHTSTHFSNQCSAQSVIVPDTTHKPNINLHMFTKHWPSKAQNTKWKHQHGINSYLVSLITKMTNSLN